MSLEIQSDPAKPAFGTSLYVLTFRVILTAIVTLLGYVYLFKKIEKIKRRNALIDKLPGPPSFNLVMGNLPIEVLKYVGADYEASKHLYSSK